MKIKYSYGDYSSKGRKEDNQDSYGMIAPKDQQLKSKGITLAVADGMSICEDGKTASELAVKAMFHDYYEYNDMADVKTAVSKVLNANNHWLYSQPPNGSYPYKLATTLSALVIKGVFAHIFHIGDCRIYLYRGGHFEQLTQDHVISDMGRKDILNKAMGTSPYLQIDYRQIELQKNDQLILMSDGCYRHICFDKMAQILNLVKSKEKAARAIVDCAYNNGSKDNLTFQIFEVESIEQDQEAYLFGRELAFPPILNVGDVIDDYEVLNEIYASTRSHLYLVQSQKSGQKFSLKIPSPNYIDDAEFIQAFKREIWVGHQLNHANIVAHQPIGDEQQSLYLIREYVEGQNLREWCQDQPQIELKNIRPILKQMIKSVRYLHRKGIQHQDLKPDNFIIDKNGVVKLTDFGSVMISSIMENDALMSVPLGSVDYTAPELLQQKKVNNNADLYSIGAIIYEMLSGHLPFGKGFASVKDVKRLQYKSLRQKCEDLPFWVDDIVQKAVNKNPESRYQNLSEFEHDFFNGKKFIEEIRFEPLIERNPVRFWQVTSFVLGFIILMLLIN